MRYFLLMLLLVASSAFADAEFRQGRDWIRITARPCSDEKVVAALTAAGEDPLDYRAAAAEIGGQGFVACWKPVMDKRVVLLRYGDGDQGMVPFDELKAAKEA